MSFPIKNYLFSHTIYVQNETYITMDRMDNTSKMKASTEPAMT